MTEKFSKGVLERRETVEYTGKRVRISAPLCLLISLFSIRFEKLTNPSRCCSTLRVSLLDGGWLCSWVRFGLDEKKMNRRGSRRGGSACLMSVCSKGKESRANQRALGLPIR